MTIGLARVYGFSISMVPTTLCSAPVLRKKCTKTGIVFPASARRGATFGCLSLLAYLDAVKRSRSLDTWFQLVIQD
jgi:hypothetical protein